MMDLDTARARAKDVADRILQSEVPEHDELRLLATDYMFLNQRIKLVAAMTGNMIDLAERLLATVPIDTVTAGPVARARDLFDHTRKAIETI